MVENQELRSLQWQQGKCLPVIIGELHLEGLGVQQLDNRPDLTAAKSLAGHVSDQGYHIQQLDVFGHDSLDACDHRPQR